MDRELMFAALSATNEAIVRSKSSSDLYQKVCDAAVHGGNIRITGVLLPDDQGFLRIQAATSEAGFIPTISVSVDERSAHGGGLAGRAFRSGRPVVSNDVIHDDTLRPWREHSIACGVGATLAVPIMAGQRSTGVFLFCFQAAHSITDEIIGLLQRVVENVAFALERHEAIERERKAEAARRQAESNEAELHRMYVALCKINEAMMRAASRQELFDLVCEAAVLGGHFTSTTIAMVQPNDHFMKIVSSRGQNADRVRSTAFSISADHPQGRGLTGTAFRTGTACVKNAFLQDAGTSHWHALAERGGTRAGASFPLADARGPCGVLLFLASKEGVFTPEIVALLARLAENVSFALANFDRADEKRRAEEQIIFLAEHDPLTGLANRSSFDSAIKTALSVARRTSRQVAILFLDLDRFKLINDSLGHAAGDRMLIDAARRIRSCLNEADHICRQGGDEFLVLLEDTPSAEKAAAIAQKILQAVAEPFFLDGYECRIGCSIGIAIYPENGIEPEDLIKSADAAMYEAKAAGKNGYRVFNPHSTSPSIERLKLETDLRKAIEGQQLSLAYQPKVGRNGLIVGVEALLRWAHPELGAISPSTFIPIAEESGLIIPIGRWVIQTACQQNVNWQREGLPPTSMAINLSPKQFCDDGLLAFLDGVLADTGHCPSLLQLEVTETMVMQNVESAAATLGAISARGVKIAIDDFGVGYSSMSLMKHLPIDTIKIDQCFVRDLEHSSEDRAISAAIISLGQALGMKVVAEGVENDNQDSILKSFNCDEFQGYLYSRPVPADAVGDLFSATAGLRVNISAPPLVPNLPRIDLMKCKDTSN